ncbi:MAG: thioesterase [Desulforudis sp.]|jgi:predicted thioesterase|nr:thioesterase [Clostridia bacterium]RJX17748.1 MAG: thioesterase [Desulforudis sp.]
MEIAVGDAGLSEFVVKKEDTALLQGSGELPVFSTPRMIALMESAAVDALRGRLAPGETSVGIGVDVRHLAASPVGVSVRAVARVVEVKARRITFEVEARDGVDIIGRGRHDRYVVEAKPFLEKTLRKGVARRSLTTDGLT